MENTVEFTIASEQFFKFNAKIMTLQRLAAALARGIIKNRTVVEEVLSQFNLEAKANKNSTNWLGSYKTLFEGNFFKGD